MNFQDKLDKAISKNNSLVCVGLDPDPTKLKKGQNQFEFNKTIIDQTADLICCFKPQIAFYSATGVEGLDHLWKTIEYIHQKYQNVPVLLDAKRGDIGHTSEMYVREVFGFLNADAVTVNPYLGEDSLEPFLKRRDKGIVVLCRTSNPSAVDFQNLKVDDELLYIKVARKVVDWDKKYRNLLMVVGATFPNEMRKIRKIAPYITFLVPGVGTQNGDLGNTLKNGLRKDGKGLIISASRSIIFSKNPRKEAQKLKNEINKYR